MDSSAFTAHPNFWLVVRSFPAGNKPLGCGECDNDDVNAPVDVLVSKTQLETALSISPNTFFSSDAFPLHYFTILPFYALSKSSHNVIIAGYVSSLKTL